MYLAKPEINANKICNVVTERCNDTERLKVFSNISEKISLVFYCEMKQESGKECYTDECTKNERMGIWLKAGTWKLTGIRRGSERGKCPLCMGEEGAKHTWLKCPEMKKQRELVCSND
jgi:hypothetical protein